MPDDFTVIPSIASSAGPPSHAPQATLDLTEVAIALSDALDLVGVQDVRHGKRVAFMADREARERGGEDAEPVFRREMPGVRQRPAPAADEGRSEA